MNIFGEISKLIFVCDVYRFVTTLEKWTNSFVASIKISDVFGDERAHKVTDAILRALLEHEMKVIGHETVGEEFDFSRVIFENFGGSNRELSLRGQSSQVG